MNKEAIELLERAWTFHYRMKFDPHHPDTCDCEYCQLVKSIDQALTLLKQPKCKTCGDTGQIGEEIVKHGRSMGYAACPDCHPPEGEFTILLRENVLEKGNWQDEPFKTMLTDDVLEACDIIDRMEAENKRLKKAIEDYGNNPAGFDWAVLEKIEIQEAINKELVEALEGLINYHYYNNMGVKPKEYHKAIQAISKAKETGSKG